MTRVALDSNILIYAELEPDSDEGMRAADLILRAARDGIRSRARRLQGNGRD